jgi:hypothetical protein
MKTVPEHKHVERVARALYDATKTDEYGKTLSWGAMVKHAETDATGRRLLNHWYALAIASIDMANGARARLRDE